MSGYEKNNGKRWMHSSETFVSIRPTLLIFLLNPSFPFYIGENKGFLVAFRNGEILMGDWGLITKKSPHESFYESDIMQ
jgi:hypothetical protein